MTRDHTRILSSTERAYLVLGGLYPPFANQYFWEGDGVLDAGLWRAAVKKAAEANPGCRLSLRGVLNRSRWVDSGSPPPVREIDGSRWPGMSSDGAPFLATPLFPRTGRGCEILLIHGSPLRVVFRTHHAVMDGRGTQTLAEDVFRALRGEPLIGSECRTVEQELARSFQRGRRPASPAVHIAPTGRADGSGRVMRWQRFQVKGTYKKIVSQVSVVLAREARTHSSGPVRIGIPVDLRPRRNGLRSTSNLTNFIYVDVNPGDTHDDIDGDIRRQMEEGRDGMLYPGDELIRYMPLWLIRLMVNRRIRRNHGRGLYNTTALISNLGKKDLGDFSGGGFNATAFWAIPPGSELYPYSIVLAGHGDTIEIIITIPEVMATGGRFDRSIEALAGGLEKLR
ncbi:MAG TPA: hypothetical protein PL180_01920 [Spirochaetota bacterium]|nr:hypothetical protein [Spirochaetota bacterium]